MGVAMRKSWKVLYVVLLFLIILGLFPIACVNKDNPNSPATNSDFLATTTIIITPGVLTPSLTPTPTYTQACWLGTSPTCTPTDTTTATSTSTQTSTPTAVTTQTPPPDNYFYDVGGSGPSTITLKTVSPGRVQVVNTSTFQATLPFPLTSIYGSGNFGTGEQIQINVSASGSVTIDMFKYSAPLTTMVGVGTDSCVVTIQ